MRLVANPPWPAKCRPREDCRASRSTRFFGKKVGSSLRSDLTVTRIAIIGNAAGGKSTLARKMSTARGLPCIEVDTLLWQEGWKLAPVRSDSDPDSHHRECGWWQIHPGPQNVDRARTAVHRGRHASLARRLEARSGPI